MKLFILYYIPPVNSFKGVSDHCIKTLLPTIFLSIKFNSNLSILLSQIRSHTLPSSANEASETTHWILPLGGTPGTWVYVLRPDATDSCPVVCHLLRGLDILVIHTLAKLVDDGHPSQDAVLALGANPHHLTVHGHGPGQPGRQRDTLGTPLLELTGVTPWWEPGSRGREMSAHCAGQLSEASLTALILLLLLLFDWRDGTAVGLKTIYCSDKH